VTTAQAARRMWRDLSASTLPAYGLDSRDYEFTARKYSRWKEMRGQEAMATTHYGLVADSNGIRMEATGVSINGDVLPWAHEDEVRGIILHEMAHIIAGWDADHDAPWERVCREIGAVPSHFYVLREWRNMPEHLTCVETARFYGPTFGEVAA
jgi:hypothetical protein